MDLRKIKIADLVPASYNPRKALKPGDKEYEKIKRSIEEFGYCEPVIVNSDMTIIGGHQRVTLLRDLGYTEIDCIVIEIEKTKEKALNVALNKIAGPALIDSMRSDLKSGCSRTIIPLEHIGNYGGKV